MWVSLCLGVDDANRFILCLPFLSKVLITRVGCWKKLCALDITEVGDPGFWAGFLSLICILPTSSLCVLLQPHSTSHMQARGKQMVSFFLGWGVFHGFGTDARVMECKIFKMID